MRTRRVYDTRMGKYSLTFQIRIDFVDSLKYKIRTIKTTVSPGVKASPEKPKSWIFAKFKNF